MGLFVSLFVAVVFKGFVTPTDAFFPPINKQITVV